MLTSRVCDSLLKLVRNAWIATSVVALLSSMSTPPAMAQVIVVDANPTPCTTRFTVHFITIQRAVNASAAGSTIQVCPGVYAEQVSIKKSLTLRGIQARNQGAPVIVIPVRGAVINGGPSSFPVVAQVDIAAPNVTLDSLTIDGTGGLPNNDCSVPELMGVAFEAGSSGRITRSAVRNQAVPRGAGGISGFCGTGIEVFSGAAGLVTIDNNSVRGFGGTGIETQSPATISNNVVTQGLTSAQLLTQGVGIGASLPTTITANIISHVAYGIYSSLQTGAGTTTISNNSISADDYGIFLSDNGISPAAGTSFTVSYNMISGGSQIPGLAGGGVGVLGGISNLTVQSNLISGFYYGVDGGHSGQSVTGNTISDAQVGVFGVSGVVGNVVSTNQFNDVVTLLSN